MDDYKLDQDGLYISCTVTMYYPCNQILQKDINLEKYPDLKADLENIFSTKRSLIDLARILERELLIYESKPGVFILSYKDELLAGESDGPDDALGLEKRTQSEKQLICMGESPLPELPSNMNMQK